MWNKGKDCQGQSLSFFTKMNEMARKLNLNPQNSDPERVWEIFSGAVNEGPFWMSPAPGFHPGGSFGGAPWKISGTHPESELEACAQSLYIVYIKILY